MKILLIGSFLFGSILTFAQDNCTIFVTGDAYLETAPAMGSQKPDFISYTEHRRRLKIRSQKFLRKTLAKKGYTVTDDKESANFIFELKREVLDGDLSPRLYFYANIDTVAIISDFNNRELGRGTYKRGQSNTVYRSILRGVSRDFEDAHISNLRRKDSRSASKKIPTCDDIL